MKYVYLVMYGYDYGGSFVWGAFSTLEEARENKPHDYGDSQWIQRVEVGKKDSVGPGSNAGKRYFFS